MQVPTSRDDAREVASTSRSMRKPGMASSLSSVPPVWPRPRPQTIGTGTPHAATSGARQIDTLSPTPPVECLSTLTPGTPREIEHVARVEHRLGERDRLGVVDARGRRRP